MPKYARFEHPSADGFPIYVNPDAVAYLTSTPGSDQHTIIHFGDHVLTVRGQIDFVENKLRTS